VIESYAATESIACRKLSDMIAFNDGINQRNPDGTVRTVDGNRSAPESRLRLGQTMR
jgi:hypothetical protein